MAGHSGGRVDYRRGGIRMTYVMTRQEREAFLAQVHVGIVSVAQEGLGPLAVPVWYEYEPGGNIRFTTGGGSRKAKLLEQFGRCSMCVQTEDSPYQYVSIEGPVIEMRPADIDVELRRIARRYLGPVEGDVYIEEYEPADDVMVVVLPEHWYSADYSKED
jgi:nitroimidazol reductase NimA-like FMN-containing flavoprotein (pyridoxamine 5'-phosphate oxidase superfamily)